MCALTFCVCPGDGQTLGSAPTFVSVIVVTDRRVRDKQKGDTIKQFAQVSATVGHAVRSGDLRRFLREGKKIIISTVQKFPFILDEIGHEHRGRKFAIIIDEAHSSQGGRTSAKMNIALAPRTAERTVPPNARRHVDGGGRSAGRRGPWSSAAASNGRSSTSMRCRRTWPSARARTRPSSPSPASTRTAVGG
nr:DEAD/DEAH box helicase family protein [Desulforhabdus sp. TSK]